tara:strand:- start:58 stop:390 length:333 start_codon:yes stop_codon:yes gene_type:complete
MIDDQYILFNEIDTLANLDGVNETVMFPASAALGIEPVSTTTTSIWFKAQDGTLDSDQVLFTHLAADRIAVYKALVQLLNTRTKLGFTVGANALSGTFPHKCTAVAVTLS